MISEKLIKVGDVYKIVIQSILYQIILCSMFICITFRVNYIIVMIQSLIIGLLYSWNISVARGLFSKTIPNDKKCEFMGFFSSFTYLGISFISLLSTIMSELKMSSEYLIVITFIYTIPGYFFLYVLQRKIN
jgi:MFS-type transporter involved in bile tolerance (Atg22 family)